MQLINPVTGQSEYPINLALSNRFLQLTMTGNLANGPYDDLSFHVAFFQYQSFFQNCNWNYQQNGDDGDFNACAIPGNCPANAGVVTLSTQIDLQPIVPVIQRNGPGVSDDLCS